MVPDSLLVDAESLLAACRAKGVLSAIAECCTDGLIAVVLTGIAGSSDVVDRGFVTYSNELIGVPMPLTHSYGAFAMIRARI